MFLFFWPRGMWGLSFLTRDQTCAPCIGRPSLNHWTTEKSLVCTLYLDHMRTWTCPISDIWQSCGILLDSAGLGKSLWNLLPFQKWSWVKLWSVYFWEFMKCIITQQDAKTGLTRKEWGDRKYPYPVSEARPKSDVQGTARRVWEAAARTRLQAIFSVLNKSGSWSEVEFGLLRLYVLYLNSWLS